MVKGAQCWIIENGPRISATEVLSFSVNLCLIRLASGKPLQVPRHSYLTRKKLRNRHYLKETPAQGPRTPYDFVYKQKKRVLKDLSVDFISFRKMN